MKVSWVDSMCLVVLVSWKLNENETGFSGYLDSQSVVLVVRSGEPILGASGWTPLGSILGEGRVVS